MDEIFRNSLPELEALTGHKIDVEAYERYLAEHESRAAGAHDLDDLHDALRILESVYGSAMWIWLENLLAAWKAADDQTEGGGDGK